MTDPQVLFEPEPLAAGHRATSTDFKTVRTMEKNHGRLEIREITASSMLVDYSD